jgi:hypothetical protein
MTASRARIRSPYPGGRSSLLVCVVGGGCGALPCGCCPPPAFLLFLPDLLLLLAPPLSSALLCRRSRIGARCGLTTFGLPSPPPLAFRMLLAAPFGTLQLILFGAGTTDVEVGDSVMKLLRLSFCGEAGLVGTLAEGRSSFWGLTTGDTGDVLELGVKVSPVLLFNISSCTWKRTPRKYTRIGTPPVA